MPIDTAPYSRRFGLMAESIVVETNHEPLLAAAEAAFGRFALPVEEERPPLRLRILRHEATDARFRHWRDGHMYVVAGAADVAAVDAGAGSAVAHVSVDMAANLRQVRYSFIEGPALAALTYGRGYVCAHACGIARNGLGLALMGHAGAGKSTLALAAARYGLDVFAEDGVFLRAGSHGAEFWGMPWTQRLVLDSVRFFPELADEEPILQPNGELKIEVDLDRWFPGRAQPAARPAAVVVLSRESGATSLEQADDIEELPVLWPWGGHWTADHARATTLFGQLPIYRLELGDTPVAAMPLLERLLDDLAADTTRP
ncbi:MAG: hypothetical protein ABIP53_01730 [Candidatus Limnocylindrales bacterium]